MAMTSLGSHAQVVDNKFNIALCYQNGVYLGPAYYPNGNQSIYVYLKGTKGPAISAHYNLNNHLGIGSRITTSQSSNEMNTGGLKGPAGDESLYRGSNLNAYTFTGYFRINRSFFGPGNSFRIFLDVGPTLFLSSLELGIPSSELWQGYPAGSTDLFIGASGNLGVELALTPSLGMHLYCASAYCRGNSILYEDRQILAIQLGAGLILYLGKEKTYKY